MLTHLRWILFPLAGLILVVVSAWSSGPTQFAKQYTSGQDVTPAYEGWQANPDGTFTLWFGYLNRNFEEELDIPIGPNNTLDPGGDRGQPTHFYPRRQHFVFKTLVPKDWGTERKVVWTLTIRGRTNFAKGWLQPEWEIDKLVMMENSGGGVDPENQPPSITGSPAQTITLPNTATLTATAEDDGRPKRGGGLAIRWIQYRGPGPVAIDQPTTATSTDGKPFSSTAKARFGVPGVYWIRAIAGDGSLEAFHDVAVTVK